MPLSFDDLVPNKGGSTPKQSSKGGALDFGDLVPTKKKSAAEKFYSNPTVAKVNNAGGKIGNQFLTYLTGIPQALVRTVGVVGAQKLGLAPKTGFKGKDARDFITEPLKTDSLGLPNGRSLSDMAIENQATAEVQGKSPKWAGPLIAIGSQNAEAFGDPLNILLGLGAEAKSAAPLAEKLVKTIFSDSAKRAPTEIPKTPGATLDRPTIADKVVQVVHPDGQKSFLRIPQEDFATVQTAVDGTKAGVAGKPMPDGSIWHITAKAPEDMQRLGFADRGTLNLKDLPTEALPSPAKAKTIFKQNQQEATRNADAFRKGLPSQDTLFPVDLPPAPETAQAPEFLNRLPDGKKPIVLGAEGSASFPTDAVRTAPVRERTPLAFQRETLDRNIESTFGKASDEVKAFLSEPLKDAVTQRTEFVNGLRDQLEATAKTLKISPGSRIDLAVGDFVEGTKSAEAIVKEFPKRAKQIFAAADYGRQVYKDLLTRANATITSYGYAPIPERQNYVTHTKQIMSWLEQFGSFLNGKADTLPTEISGINIETKPGRQFFNFGLERKGGSTHEGMFKAIDKYAEPVSNQIFYTGVIKRYRTFLKDLPKLTAESGNERRLSAFNSWFSEFTNKISGKKDIIDRPVEKKIGRGFLRVFDKLKQRTGANLVGASVSAALTNYIPLTQSLATTSKPAALRGLAEALMTPFKDARVIDGERSAFLTRRFPKGSISGGVGGKVRDVAGSLFKIVDEFTSHAIVSGKYYEKLAEGMGTKQAMKFADDFAARVMADRSFGQAPLLFDSKTLGAFTQFQIEVNNQYSFLFKDLRKNLGLSRKQVVGAIAQVAVYSYLYNALYEKVAGRRPAIDPIHLVQRTVEQIQNGDSTSEILDPTKSDSAGGELTNNLPFASILTGGRVPVGGVLPNPVSILNGSSTASQELQKPLYGLLPPVGGSQIRKSVKGVQAYNRGFSETASGNYRFSIDQTLPNFLRTLFFGEYSTPEARDYFKNN